MEKEWGKWDNRQIIFLSDTSLKLLYFIMMNKINQLLDPILVRTEVFLVCVGFWKVYLIKKKKKVLVKHIFSTACWSRNPFTRGDSFKYDISKYLK